MDWEAPTLWRQTGQIWPVAVPTSLTWYDMGALLHIVQAAQVDLVVEIGVDQGGLAALLLAYRDYAGQAAQTVPLTYVGIDINLATVCPLLLAQHRAHFIQADAWAAATVGAVQMLVSDAQRALVFCDGGDKPRELHLYAPILRPGDLLLAHDYQNEYTDAAFVGLPADVQRLTPVWLERTLLCLFQKH